MKVRLEAMLAAEQDVIERGLLEVTRDPTLVRAEIRAELLRAIIFIINQESIMSMHTPQQVQAWLIRIVGHEGGENHADKVGGYTKWGISQRAYPDLDIANLTVADAEAIYRRDYLAPLRADKFEDGVAYQLLDFAVNSGPLTALKQLQEAIGCEPDGWIGPVTQAALAARSESDLVMLLIAERLDYMASLKNWRVNAGGWIRRIAENLRYAALDTE